MFAERRRNEPVGTITSVGAANRIISNEELSTLLSDAYNKLRMTNEVLLVPPDGSRPDAHAPFLLAHALMHFKREAKTVIPALGTHEEMKPEDIRKFFGVDTPVELFAPHDAEHGVSTVGTISKEKVRELTGGLHDDEFPVAISNKIDGNKLVLAFPHIIPHEVMGFAGYTKHVVVGLGGEKTIAKSHEIAALYGIDETLGRADTPSRKLLHYAEEHFLKDKNIVYVMLVRSPAKEHETEAADEHGMITREVFIGNGRQLFEDAVALSRQVNMTIVEPLQEAVVYLPPENYHAFWTAMKGCYRMRLAMAEGGTLHVVCPGVRTFGENQKQSEIIGDYGYLGWSELRARFDSDQRLQRSSGVWAHLTHGSPPEIAPGKPKFTLKVYPKLAPAELQGQTLSEEQMKEHGFTQQALHAANLQFGNATELLNRFGLHPDSKVGMHGSVYFAGNPAKGLWLTQEAYERITEEG